MTSRVARLLLVLMALAYVVAELQWAHAIAWDEVEFFRATRWLGEGRVPYRDFWEHHLPLQWLLFAPFTRLFGGGAGIAPILSLRWLQLAAWLGLFAASIAVLRRAQLDASQRLIALLLLLGSPLFVRPGIEYRVDTIGNLAFVAALSLAMRNTRATWIAFGAVMSAAVLANMRLAPLVMATALLLFFVRLDERRWQWNPRALAMLAGVAAVAAAFALWLFTFGARDAFVEAMRFNLVTDRLLSREATTFLPVLLQPFTQFDVAAIGLWIGAIAGAVIALRDIRRPGALQLLALLAILSVVFVARLGVQYIYHFQTVFLLLAPLTATVIRGPRAQLPAMMFIALVLAIDLGRSIPLPRKRMAYQDAVMKTADRRTTPNERVWDGCGYALRREPAYRYWFLPSGVRMLARRYAIEPYDAPQMIAAPPAAIIHTIRINAWLHQFPRLRAYVTHHYIPLYRDLWIPGLSAEVGPRRRVTWLVPRSGTYRVYANELLVKHPWFARPLDYALVVDASPFELPLQRLPPLDASRVRITVNGVPVQALDLQLKQGELVTFDSLFPSAVGVLIVPPDVTTLFSAPEDPMIL